MQVLAKDTGSKSYKAHKYSLDHAERPYIDYSEDTIIWERTAETRIQNTYVPLERKSIDLAKRSDQLLTYFLDGSRRVYKVDDHSYTMSVGRTVIECFKREIVISVPDIANADGKAGFFEAMLIKLNQIPILKQMNTQIAKIIPYKTNTNASEKFEDRGTACIQDRMIQCEKDMVAELVKKGMLNQRNYLIKDGSLEYRPTKDIWNDERKSKIFKNNYNYVLGVSKNFNPEICKDINGKSNPGFIAELPLYLP